ncbi:MAG: hypothetical protein QM715_14305 [Nibricoccus sp.]
MNISFARKSPRIDFGHHNHASRTTTARRRNNSETFLPSRETLDLALNRSPEKAPSSRPRLHQAYLFQPSSISDHLPAASPNFNPNAPL